MNIKQLRSFALAGRAIFTCVSGKDGSHVTFRISKAKEARGGQHTFFLSVRTNVENATGSAAWAYLGVVSPATGAVVTTRKSRHEERPAFSRALAVARWILAQSFLGRDLPAGYEVKHEGSCGRCARRLTDPVSLDRGIGPECAQLIGGSL